jgi:hypothetical protein
VRKRPGVCRVTRRSKISCTRSGPTEVEVLANEVLEEQPPAQRAIQHLGQAELGLKDGQLVPVPGLAVPARERMRQAVQPLAEKRVDLLGRQAVAQRLQAPRIGTPPDAIVERLEGDPALLELPLHILVPVEAELRSVREVGAELQEERPEVPVDAVEVEVVHHGRRPHEPRIGLAGGGIAALLRPHDPRLLLRPPDEQNALRGGAARQVRRHYVVLPLTLLERDERHALRLHERLDRGQERPTDRLHQGRRRERLPAVPPEERGDPALVLQPRHVRVEVHAVDTLDLQGDVLTQDLGDAPW